MTSKYEDHGAPAQKFEIDHMHDVDAPDNLAAEQVGLKRDLRLRHMIMIAISGTIGTGLFLTSGRSIATAGPAGALVSYALIGIWLVFVCQAIGEIATLLPLPGAFNAWGARVFDEAFSFQMTWMYFMNWALTIPAELAAAAVITEFWSAGTGFPSWVVCVLIIAIMVVVNLVGVKAYGELEYWFSILKVCTIIMFIICGICVDAGWLGNPKQVYGVKSWSIPDSPFKGGFMAFVRTLVSTGFAYGGTEMTGVTAAESRNPHKHVPRAVNTVLLRIAFFYITSVFLLGAIIPHDDEDLINPDGSAKGAAFTLVFARAGISGAANFMNAVVFTSIFSAINSDFYIATRMLLSLSRNGWAHKSIGYTNKRGVPLVALAIITTCSCLSLVTIFVGSGVVFQWFVSIIGSIILQSWMLILFLHFRFRYCWKKQGRPVSDLPYVSWGYPYGTILATIIGLFVLGCNFYLSFLDPPVHPGDGASDADLAAYKKARDAFIQNLLGTWFPWVFSAILFFGYKFTRGTKLIKAEEADLDTGRFIPSQKDTAELTQKQPLYKRFFKIFL
ncbi:hypothetical protein BGW42_003097 [Actinomortierella wolfii]|nr:hypothetical protein BGW42_003097 [Actinomortierella wolfii]